MGSVFGKLCSPKKKQLRILLVGLDDAGKTTILYKLKLGEVVTTIPTIGINVESIQYKNTELAFWDVAGQVGSRPIWRHYYHIADCVLFVVDSSDPNRLDGEREEYTAKEELHRMLAEEELSHAILLVFANKQDTQGCLSVAEVSDRLGLNTLRERQWHIHGTVATTGEGLYEGLDWLVSL